MRKIKLIFKLNPLTLKISISKGPQLIHPLSISQFPTNIETNCFGFAIGRTLKHQEFSSDYVLDSSLPIGKAFIKKLKEFGYKNLPVEVKNINLVPEGCYVFMAIGFKEKQVQTYSLGIPFKDRIFDYHIIRREPSGTWVHKPGWGYPPTYIRPEDWNTFKELYGSESAIFYLPNSIQKF